MDLGLIMELYPRSFLTFGHILLEGRVDQVHSTHVGKEKKQAMVIYRNAEARSLNHFFRRKAIGTEYSECVCSLNYPAYKVHAPCCIVICGLSGCTIFFHIIS